MKLPYAGNFAMFRNEHAHVVCERIRQHGLVKTAKSVCTLHAFDENILRRLLEAATLHQRRLQLIPSDLALTKSLRSFP